MNSPLTASRTSRTAVLPTLAIGLGLALLLTGCGGTAPSGAETGATPRPTGSTTTEPAPDSTDVDTDTSAAEEPAEATPDACGLLPDDYAIIREALQTSNHAAIGPYLADSVYVTYASTEDEGAVDDNPGLVLQNLQDVSYPGPTWTFDIPASDLATWAASPYYAEDFTDCAIVGITSDDRGVSLTVADGEITRELITFTVEAWGY